MTYAGDVEPGTSIEEDAAALLRSMAERIEINRGAGFAGAFVIVPPGSEPQQLLILDGQMNPIVFWSTLKTKVDLALDEISNKDKQKGWR